MRSNQFFLNKFWGQEVPSNHQTKWKTEAQPGPR